MSEVEFEVNVEQTSYDEFKKPMAYASIKGVSKEEAIKCLRLLIDGLERIPHVANPNG